MRVLKNRRSLLVADGNHAIARAGERTKVSCSVHNHIKALRFERYACTTLGAGSARGCPMEMRFGGETNVRGTHLMNQNEDGEEMGEIGCPLGKSD